MKRLIALLLLLLVTATLSSCGANYAVTGNYNLNTTQVQLASNNYQIINKVSGSADVSYICMIGGLSKEQLYENAYSAMMANAGLVGSRAVINVVTEEHIGGFIPFYYTRTITVSANVIEFIK